MEIRWSAPAEEDLERICEHIERDNPDVARRVARIIYEGCARLSVCWQSERPDDRTQGTYIHSVALHRCLSSE
jgi:plasmid stabilization system protein ParE